MRKRWCGQSGRWARVGHLKPSARKLGARLLRVPQARYRKAALFEHEDRGQLRLEHLSSELPIEPRLLSAPGKQGGDRRVPPLVYGVYVVRWPLRVIDCWRP